MTSIGFALLSNSVSPIPSTRIACLNIFPLLRQMGFEPIVVFEPGEASEMPDVSGLVDKVLGLGLGIVVFQKIHGPSVLAAVRSLQKARVRTVYCVCDIVDNEMVEATDATIVVTDFLKSLYASSLQERIHVVHDGIEHPEFHRKPTVATQRRRLIATLVTSHSTYVVPVIGGAPQGWGIDIVGAFPPASELFARLRALRWAMHREKNVVERLHILRAALDPHIRHICWTADSVYAQLCDSDIAIIPIDTSLDDSVSPPSWKVKSENRLTLKMAIGSPVIATPIPAYEGIIEHGVNGFFAHSADDWKRCFKKLRDPELRLEMGAKARESVLLRFSQMRQAEGFAQVLQTLGIGKIQ
jgi:hypothetical protein